MNYAHSCLTDQIVCEDVFFFCIQFSLIKVIMISDQNRLKKEKRRSCC